MATLSGTTLKKQRKYQAELYSTKIQLGFLFIVND